MNLRDAETRAAFETVAKYTAIAIGGAWTLWVGTDYLDKQEAALELSNAALSVNSIPTASTTINLVEKSLPEGGAFCFVEGTYSIENTGKLPIIIEPATIEIYELDNVLLQDGQKAVSYSMETVLKDLEPILVESLGKKEGIGVGNRYDRAFGYTVRREDNHHYILVANAQGSLPSSDDDPADFRLLRDFGENDLRHVTHLGASCPAQAFG